MSGIFLKILNLGISACIPVLAVIVIRMIFKKAPGWVKCLLWIPVGLRLLLPVRLESVLSLIPSAEPLPEAVISGGGFAVNSGIPAVDVPVNGYFEQRYSAQSAAVDIMTILGAVWLAGLAAMLVYALISCLKIRKQTEISMPCGKNTFICDGIDTPFIFGIFRPKIYLPSGLSEKETEYILAHENAHLARHDHWWKPAAFALLSVYWFNPAIWIAYILLCRDIELACDEKVIGRGGEDIKKSYSETLLKCSSVRRLVSACPVAFGETGVKQRIRNILNYKKPAFWVIIVAVIAAAAAAVCFLTDPVTTAPEGEKRTFYQPDAALDAAVSKLILDKYGDNDISECITEGHIIFGCETVDVIGTDEAVIKVYGINAFSGFGFVNGKFAEVTGSIEPAVMTFIKRGNEYEFREVEYAGDGSFYLKSINELFPEEYRERAVSPSDEEMKPIIEQSFAQAEKYLDSIGRKAEIISYERPVLFEDAGIPVEVSNNLLDTLCRDEYYPDFIGTKELVQNGVRYVYETKYDKNTQKIIATKTEYDTGKIVSSLEASALTGEILAVNSVPAQTGTSGDPEPVMLPGNIASEFWISEFGGDLAAGMKEEDCEFFKEIIIDAQWSSETFDNIPDVIIKAASGEEYAYQLSEGILNHNDTCIRLTGKELEKMDSMVNYYLDFLSGQHTIN